MKKSLAGLSIQSGQHMMLLHICDQPGIGQDELAEHLIMNKSTVARAVTRLERDGWIRRAANEKDLRAFLLFPQEQAFTVIDAIRKAVRDWAGRLTEGLSGEEVDMVSKALGTMARNAVSGSRAVSGSEGPGTLRKLEKKDAGTLYE